MLKRSITEKIIERHAASKNFRTGDFLFVNVDFSFANDVTAPLSIREFKSVSSKVKVFNKNKIGLIPDHFTPAKDIKSAQNVKTMRDFARQYKITHFYDVGVCGIEHAFIPEKGLILPGNIVIGADSHTCTYGALGALSFGVGSTDIAFSWATGKIWIKVPPVLLFILRGKLKKYVTSKDVILHTIGKIGVDGAQYKVMEFRGPIIDNMSQDARFTLCNMAIEAGGKTAILAPDRTTFSYLKSLGKKIDSRQYSYLKSDREYSFQKVFDWDLSGLDPQVAFPHLPSNTRSIKNTGNISIDQVVIGSCTNGRIEDLRQAASILKSKKINSRVRCLIFPATPKVLLQAQKEGLVKTFLESGAILCPASCGPCLGGHMGVLAEGERCLATTNRNFIGRMGHPKSEVYLSNPYIAAASAIKGKICGP